MVARQMSCKVHFDADWIEVGVHLDGIHTCQGHASAFRIGCCIVLRQSMKHWKPTDKSTKLHAMSELQLTDMLEKQVDRLTVLDQRILDVNPAVRRGLVQRQFSSRRRSVLPVHVQLIFTISPLIDLVQPGQSCERLLTIAEP